jgi:polar amino acid transport system substrate-binding protein
MAVRARFCLALASILILLASSSRADEPTDENVLVNGIDPNFPPFAYVDSNGKPDGLDVKAVEWIAREMGFQVVHQPLDWDMMLRALREKNVDFVASGMNITEKGLEIANYTIPYWTVRKFIVADKGSKLNVDQTLDKGNRLGVLRGADETEWIEENLIKQAGRKIRLVYYDEITSALEDLKLGRIKGIAMTSTLAQEVMKKTEIRLVGTFGMPDELFAYAVLKENAFLLETLNRGLQKLMGSPYWEELKKKYME